MSGPPALAKRSPPLSWLGSACSVATLAKVAVDVAEHVLPIERDCKEPKTDKGDGQNHEVHQRKASSDGLTQLRASVGAQHVPDAVDRVDELPIVSRIDLLS